LQFVTEEAAKPVAGRTNLTITTPDRFRKFVEGLESFKGHDDDKSRKKKRKDLLLLAKYEEKEFTPGDLTKTSQLVRLAAQAVERHFQKEKTPPVIVSLPGSVTGLVRKSWDLMGCLAQANPQTLDTNGEVKSKTEIRDITHLHHALDACVLGFTSHFIPKNGRVWELLLKRNLAPAEEKELKALGVFGRAVDGRFQLLELPQRLRDQISARLCEKRVVQHIPASMNGLRAEQNVWRVVEIKDGKTMLRQSSRGPDQKRSKPKTVAENTSKLVGVFPRGEGNLSKLKGALVIADNFGVAITDEPVVVPFFKVYPTIRSLREAHGGKPFPVLRNGHLFSVTRGKNAGVWRVLSVSNKAAGVMIKFGPADLVRRVEKPINYREGLLNSLIRDGLEIISKTLVGLSSCPTTSSASMPRNVR
jgi:CRISPR-associated endonuclease Csn1